jgi:hypothetical protein
MRAMSDDARQFAPATARNREPILEVLRRVLPAHGTVLEISSGTGEHVTFFGPKLPDLTWQPSDPDPVARASIAGWIVATAASNVRPPLDLDVLSPVWPVAASDAIACINMIHIAPWTATPALFAGARRILPRGGVLYLYGPFRRDGRHTAPSNEAFDASLQARNPEWGVRDLGDVAAEAARAGFGPPAVTPMPANNLSVVFVVL